MGGGGGWWWVFLWLCAMLWGCGLGAWRWGWVGVDGGVVMLKKFAFKPGLLGGVCLLGAGVLVWFSPKEGVGEFFRRGAGSGDGGAVRTKVGDRGGEGDGGSGVEGELRGVVEEYMMRAERGMTVDEVRWVVEDFLALGLEVDYPEVGTAEGYLALRRGREEWYLGALVSGLRLTREQEGEAREAMGVLRGRDYAEFLGYLEGVRSFEHEGREMRLMDGDRGRKFLDASRWLEEEGGYAPWVLCELDEGQRAISADGDVRAGAMDVGEGEGWGNRVGEDGMLDPFFANLFPFTEKQVLRLAEVKEDGGGALEVLMSFHPGQLKLFLLLDSGVDGWVGEVLEAGE